MIATENMLMRIITHVWSEKAEKIPIFGGSKKLYILAATSLATKVYESGKKH